MTLKDFKQLTSINENIDYFDKGLKCGLEIHQQLNTNKLFCNCSTNSNTNVKNITFDYIVKRNLRSSKSELGHIDAAAKFEMKKSKTNLYYGSHKSSCLVELDEEPPHSPNKDALLICLEVAKFFEMNSVDKLSFMRKIVVDGSNTTGFQRTALVAKAGIIEEKNVRIESLCLEEDACKKIKDYVKKNEYYSEYDLSRLGIPLIEIATAPDIKSPIQAKEVAEYIGMVLRSTGKVKRGIGTIRQDVNVSINGGVRVEIKGAQELNMIPKLIIYEIMRQQNLLNIYSELKKMTIIISEPEQVTDIFLQTNSKILSAALSEKKSIFAIKISNCAGCFGLEIQPNRRFGSEIADHVKPFGIRGLFHSDEKLAKYGLTTQEVDKLKTRLHCNKEDAFIILAEEETKAKLALEEVKEFLSKLKLEKEVRQAKPDATSTFLRPMPGSARMYPETDIPGIVINKNLLKALQPITLLSEQYKELETIGIEKTYAKELLKQGFNINFLVKKYSNLKPEFIAEFLLDYPKEIKKRNNLNVDITKYVDEILTKLNNNSITKEAAFGVLILKAQGKSIDYAQFKALDDEFVKNRIKDIINNNKTAPANAIMGLCMKEFRGKIEGKKVKQFIDALFN